jgi:hypothetical protein
MPDGKERIGAGTLPRRRRGCRGRNREGNSRADPRGRAELNLRPGALAFLALVGLSGQAFAGPPSIVCPPLQYTYENGGVLFFITASDPDGDPVVLRCMNARKRAEFTPTWAVPVGSRLHAGGRLQHRVHAVAGVDSVVHGPDPVDNFDRPPTLTCPPRSHGWHHVLPRSTYDLDHDPLVQQYRCSRRGDCRRPACPTGRPRATKGTYDRGPGCRTALTAGCADDPTHGWRAVAEHTVPRPQTVSSSRNCSSTSWRRIRVACHSGRRSRICLRVRSRPRAATSAGRRA